MSVSSSSSSFRLFPFVWWAPPASGSEWGPGGDNKVGSGSGSGYVLEIIIRILDIFLVTGF
jgi:hypothetical protein